MLNQHGSTDVAFRASRPAPAFERRVWYPDAETGRPLTPAQLHVLNLAAEGCTSAAIAERLGCTLHTVNRHLSNAYGRLGLPKHDRQRTMIAAFRALGWLRPPWSES